MFGLVLITATRSPYGYGAAQLSNPAGDPKQCFGAGVEFNVRIHSHAQIRRTPAYRTSFAPETIRQRATNTIISNEIEQNQRLRPLSSAHNGLLAGSSLTDACRLNDRRSARSTICDTLRHQTPLGEMSAEDPVRRPAQHAAVAWRR